MTIEVAELIGGFYEAAVEPARFPEALRQLGTYGDGIGAGLLVWDKRTRQTALLAMSDHAGADASEAYERHYAPLDPYRPLIDTLPTGTWTASSAFFDDRFVARDVFFNEYLLPRNIRHMTGARVLSGDGFDVYVGVHRSPRHRPFARDEVARLETVGRQLARAARLHIELTYTRLGRETGSRGLAQLAKPALLVDATARVLYANPAAEALLLAPAPITIERGRVVARATADTSRLQHLIHGATHGRGGGELLVPATAETPATAVAVTPAGPLTTLYSLMPVDVALVLVQSPPDTAPSMVRPQMLFGLTRAERALAESLADGKRLAEIATARNVSIETVRTQLRALFRKTGTARQPDLIRVLLAARDSP